MAEQKKNATIYDVAEKVGVSLATVSRVVNGNDNVRQSTRDKVLKAIDELGYQPNAVARGLASKKTTTIGVVMPDVTNIFYSELTRGVDDIAQMYQYDALLTNTDDEQDRAVTAIKNLLTKQVDGIIYMGTKLSEPVMAMIQSAGVPIVLAGSVAENEALPSVNIDYVTAFETVTTKLLARGHQRIALVLGSRDRAIDQDFRLVGYQRALQEAGIDYDDQLVFAKARTYEAGQLQAADLMAQDVTAVVAYDDEIAVSILNYYQDHGYKVPEDLEIVTSNNTNFSIVSRPELSSINQPKYDIGAVAMRMLTKLMNGEKLTETQIKLPYTLISRGSTRTK
ncbi:substrate-binding domain-containing protein [Fructobacillus tropaeoli]|uniref:LacI/PurR family (PurR) n=1 Tax=Fructobacillus tropaeoli TaxID=709323 RepID=A0ABM9MZ28_9LACO|nr:substrate-binding domain-containing protein [Fructobacillus tropaeoli]NLS37480.1 LacI family DNA-binding transcriptional regulator [Fructobacillus tropaeoli]CAK1226574.1 DNA-binding transcriptional regulator [Fructobacillus tropaeoli]CAK1228305.1 DNA-binding transcriptional regulator [Fructobacillus tropaeoli]CAK1250369.1 DNA-binding transcriptional regulator [Fructobacillus tropaeoli]